jgi:serine/threonine-protein kinase
MNYGRYEIISELGKGAMGIVYLAHDPNINRKIALKILRPERVSSPDFLHRFLKEALAIGRLAHHNIVTVYDVGEDRETVYIAMEYLEGRPLNQLAKEETLNIKQVIDIGTQVADALDYAHSKGIIHRDIKPQNIILTNDGKVKITDFGIAHIEDPESSLQTQAGEILGTPSYMSPEQVMGEKVDGRSDLFSLGVILYELATGGTRPFKGGNLASIFKSITMDEPVIPVKENPQIPPYLSDSIMKSLRKEPEKRFQAGREMSQALVDSVKEKPISIETKQDSGKNSSSIIFVLVLIIIVLLVSGGVFLLKRDSTGKSSPEAGLKNKSIAVTNPLNIKAPPVKTEKPAPQLEKIKPEQVKGKTISEIKPKKIIEKKKEQKIANKPEDSTALAPEIPNDYQNDMNSMQRPLTTAEQLSILKQQYEITKDPQTKIKIDELQKK